MPQRRIETGIWTDPWFQGLTAEQSFLFIYLWSNDHCNQAGLYQITLTTIAFETKLPEQNISALLAALNPKVEWYPEHNIVWVKNFLRKQESSHTFYSAACKCVMALNNNSHLNLLDKFIKYNEKLGYRYPSGRVPIPSMTMTKTMTMTKEGGDSKGEETKTPSVAKDPKVIRQLAKGVRLNRESDVGSELMPLNRVGRKLPGSMQGVLEKIQKDIEEKQEKRAKKK